MEDIPAEYLGPKMQALPSEKWRRFAFLVGHGETVGADAARQAGYSDTGEACKVRAAELLQDNRVLDAIREVGGKALRALAPIAVRRARAILDNPKHSQHARMIEVVFDRTGYAVATEHKVTVTHAVDIRELEALARRLAQESGVPVQRLLGPDSKVIEHQELETDVSRETLTQDGNV